jgi:hypothetical protein
MESKQERRQVIKQEGEQEMKRKRKTKGRRNETQRETGTAGKQGRSQEIKWEGQVRVAGNEHERN